jgi:beta-aspartyl-peptidase (threonine type)
MKVVLLALLLSAALMVLAAAPAKEAPEAAKVVLVVHGGAGDLPRDKDAPELKQRREGIEKALRAGYDALQKEGGSSLDAVEAAIRVMEDDPAFNAGRGAVFTHEGRNELDASIMEGKEKRAGAVAGVSIIKNPISAARAVMEHSKHVLLIGRGAELFAIQQDLKVVHPDYFRTPGRLKELQEEIDKEDKARQEKGRRQGKGFRPHHYFGTVGCVALDGKGNLAAGTSTGGMTNKMTGRIGDSPIIGAGTYADNQTCAVSGTGHGEIFIRYAVAHDISARLKYGRERTTVQDAADAAIKGLPWEEGGVGGVIALDTQGRMAMSFDTQRMYRGYATSDGKFHVRITEKQPGWMQRGDR